MMRSNLLRKNGAGDEIRTHDPQHGKVRLHNFIERMFNNLYGAFRTIPGKISTNSGACQTINVTYASHCSFTPAAHAASLNATTSLELVKSRRCV